VAQKEALVGFTRGYMSFLKFNHFQVSLKKNLGKVWHKADEIF
jgi:hypothetical protein